jgi:hypothetical protein
MKKRFLISILLGCTIAGLGFACAIYGLGHAGVENVFGLLGLMLNWHIVFLCSSLFPVFGNQVDTILFAAVFPAIEWAAIMFAVMTLMSHLRRRPCGANRV